jgi:hypothetical protein
MGNMAAKKQHRMKDAELTARVHTHTLNMRIISANY